MGPLGIVFNTPSHHRVHHGRNPYCIDKNYGGVLIIWDKMFNTFAAEKKDDPPVYGLIHNENTFNQLYLQVCDLLFLVVVYITLLTFIYCLFQFHTLYEMLFCKWRMKNKKGEPIFKAWLDKVRAVFYPPGWFPGVPVEPFFHWMSMVNPAYKVPDIEYPVVKYNPPLELWKKVYCSMHFLIQLMIFMHFEFDRGDLTYEDFTVKIIFFVITAQGFGAIFDQA